MKLKWIALFILLSIPFFFASGSFAGPDTVSKIRWHDYPEGIALGKEEGKKVFLYFWADWCAYCTRMAKETFVDSTVVELLNSAFISIKVDYDREQKVASEYSVRGLPSTFFIAESGDRIGSRPGFISAKDLISTLKYIHTDSYKNMTLKTFLKEK